MAKLFSDQTDEEWSLLDWSQHSVAPAKRFGVCFHSDPVHGGRGLAVSDDVQTGAVLLTLPWDRVLTRARAATRLDAYESAGQGLLPGGMGPARAPGGLLHATRSSELKAWSIEMALFHLAELRNPASSFKPWARLLPMPVALKRMASVSAAASVGEKDLLLLHLLRNGSDADDPGGDGSSEEDSALACDDSFRLLGDPTLEARLRHEYAWLKAAWQELFRFPPLLDASARCPSAERSAAAAVISCRFSGCKRKAPLGSTIDVCPEHRRPAASFESFLWAFVLVRSRAFELSLSNPQQSGENGGMAHMASAAGGAAAAASSRVEQQRVFLPFIDMCNHHCPANASLRFAGSKGIELVAERNLCAGSPILLDYGKRDIREIVHSFAFLPHCPRIKIDEAGVTPCACSVSFDLLLPPSIRKAAALQEKKHTQMLHETLASLSLPKKKTMQEHPHSGGLADGLGGGGGGGDGGGTSKCGWARLQVVCPGEACPHAGPTSEAPGSAFHLRKIEVVAQDSADLWGVVYHVHELPRGGSYLSESIRPSLCRKGRPPCRLRVSSRDNGRKIFDKDDHHKGSDDEHTDEDEDDKCDEGDESSFLVRTLHDALLRWLSAHLVDQNSISNARKAGKAEMTPLESRDEGGAYAAAVRLARSYAHFRALLLDAVSSDLAPVDLYRFPEAVGITADLLGLLPANPSTGSEQQQQQQQRQQQQHRPVRVHVKEYTLAQVAHPGNASSGTMESSDSQRYLLGLKLRGFGQGKWNGFGGKLEPGESATAAAKRELEEEAGVTPVDAESMEYRGRILFAYRGSPKLMLVHHFMVEAFKGDIRFVPRRSYDCDATCEDRDDGGAEALMESSPEMAPEWFRRCHIPYSRMWADDELWLEQVLDGASVAGSVLFEEGGAIILDHDLSFSWPSPVAALSSVA